MQAAEQFGPKSVIQENKDRNRGCDAVVIPGLGVLPLKSVIQENSRIETSGSLMVLAMVALPKSVIQEKQGSKHNHVSTTPLAERTVEPTRRDPGEQGSKRIYILTHQGWSEAEERDPGEQGSKPDSREVPARACSAKYLAEERDPGEQGLETYQIYKATGYRAMESA